jgi:hypothetical protein
VYTGRVGFSIWAKPKGSRVCQTTKPVFEGSGSGWGHSQTRGLRVCRVDAHRSSGRVGFGFGFGSNPIRQVRKRVRVRPYDPLRPGVGSGSRVRPFGAISGRPGRRSGSRVCRLGCGSRPRVFHKVRPETAPADTFPALQVQGCLKDRLEGRLSKTVSRTVSRRPFSGPSSGPSQDRLKGLLEDRLQGRLEAVSTTV